MNTPGRCALRGKEIATELTALSKLLRSARWRDVDAEALLGDLIIARNCLRAARAKLEIQDE